MFMVSDGVSGRVCWVTCENVRAAVADDVRFFSSLVSSAFDCVLVTWTVRQLVKERLVTRMMVYYNG